MSSNFDPTSASPWTDTPGLYAILNIDGQSALDEDRDAKPQIIHGWDYGDSFKIANVNQLWQLADIGEKKWLVINKKTGHYLAAKGAYPSDFAKTGDADMNSAHWRIAMAKAGDLFKLYIYSVKLNGRCLTLENGNGINGTNIKCATRNRVEKGQIWVVKKQN